METVEHERVGMLCAPTPAAFASALQRLLCDHDNGGDLDVQEMGVAAKARVESLFSRAAFGNKLQAHLEAVLGCNSTGKET